MLKKQKHGIFNIKNAKKMVQIILIKLKIFYSILIKEGNM